MRQKLIALLAVVCLVGATPSCTNTGALPFVSPSANVAASTYSVQAAEKLLLGARDTLDLLLNLDDINRALVKEKLPAVHAFAEKMRRDNYAINTLQRADRAKNTFKHNRTADNQADLNTIMMTVFQLKSDMETNVLKIQKAKS